MKQIQHYGKRAWQGWLRVGKVIGNFQAQVIFSLFYLTFLLPVGIGMRFFNDPLGMKRYTQRKSNFQKWMHIREDSTTARRQF